MSGHSGSLNRGLEEAHRRGGQHFTKEQRRQPPSALAQHGGQADIEIRRVQRLGAADLLDVFRRLFFRDVRQIVRRDHAQQLLVVIDNRKCSIFVTSQDACDLLLIHGRRHRDHVGPFNRAQGLTRRREYQVPH